MHNGVFYLSLYFAIFYFLINCEGFSYPKIEIANHDDASGYFYLLQPVIKSWYCFDNCHFSTNALLGSRIANIFTAYVAQCQRYGLVYTAYKQDIVGKKLLGSNPDQVKKISLYIIHSLFSLYLTWFTPIQSFFLKGIFIQNMFRRYPKNR